MREQVERLEHDPDPPPDPVDVDALAVISSPSTKIRPASIGSSRLMQRSSVDLPIPDAPIRHTTSCSATLEVDPAQDLELAERLVEPLDREGSAVRPTAVDGRRAWTARRVGRGRRASR